MVVISNQDTFHEDEGLDDIFEDEEECYGRKQKQIEMKWKKRNEERSKISAPNSHLDKKKRFKKLQIDAGEGTSSQRNFGGTGIGEKRKLERSLFTISDDEEGEALEEEEDGPETLQINEESNDAPPTNASRISLSFCKEMKYHYDRYKVYLPKAFVRRTGIRANMIVKLINIEGREWPVYVLNKPFLVFGRGWCDFLCDNKVTFNSIISFVWLRENKLKVHIEMGTNKPPMFSSAPKLNQCIRSERSTSSRTKRSKMMVGFVAPASSYESESTQYQEESANNTTSLSFTCDEDDSEKPTETTIGETSMLTGGMTISNPNVLNCPVCLCPLTIPVHQCDEGHFSCQSCYDKIKEKCPTCSKPIGNKRCIGMENVLKSVNISCQNMQYGCKKNISYCKKLDHENSCKYVPTSCPHFRCKYVGMVKSFYDHYVEKHPDSCSLIAFNRGNSINVVGEEHYILLEKKEKILFYLTRVIDPLGSLVCVSTASNMKLSCDIKAVSSDKSITMKSAVEIAPRCFTKPAKEECFLITRTFHREEASNGVSMLPLELVIRKA